MERKDYIAVSLTPDKIDSFLVYLRKNECCDAIVRQYAGDLMTFYHGLPGDKILTSDTVVSWRHSLLETGFSVNTINAQISACNCLLSFLNRESWQVPLISLSETDSIPSLFREECYMLLKTARYHNKELVYFLIKTICCLGLSVGELPFLTVKSIVSGNVRIITKNRVRTIPIPSVLQVELLNYAKRASINSGSLFKSSVGKPFNLAFILKELSELCKEAGIPEEKGTPQNLRELYLNTYSSIRAAESASYDRAYS